MAGDNGDDGRDELGWWDEKIWVWRSFSTSFVFRNKNITLLGLSFAQLSLQLQRCHAINCNPQVLSNTIKLVNITKF